MHVINAEILKKAKTTADQLRAKRPAGETDDQTARKVLAQAGWKFSRARDRWVWEDGSEAEPGLTLQEAVILAAAARVVATAPASETVDRAAVRKDGVVYDVPRPGRHDAAIQRAHAALNLRTAPMEPLGAHEQGFVTSTGRFVGRKEAAKLAHEAGQIEQRTNMLFTEDLW